MSHPKTLHPGESLLDFIEAYGAEVAKHCLAEAVKGEEDRLRLAKRIGLGVADRLRDDWGGQQIYIPIDLTRRNAKIYSEFTGDNHAALAERHHLGIHRVYQIIRQERERRRPTQGSLLDETQGQ